MNTNASLAMIASPISTAATAIPDIATALSPDELCDTVAVPLVDAAPAVAVITDEVDIDEDTEEVEEEDEEVLAELGAAADVPGKSLSGMAWNFVSVRGFWQLTVLSEYSQQDHNCEVAL
jgi:hypothetical protein